MFTMYNILTLCILKNSHQNSSLDVTLQLFEDSLPASQPIFFEYRPVDVVNIGCSKDLAVSSQSTETRSKFSSNVCVMHQGYKQALFWGNSAYIIHFDYPFQVLISGNLSLVFHLHFSLFFSLSHLFLSCASSHTFPGVFLKTNSLVKVNTRLGSFTLLHYIISLSAL